MILIQNTLNGNPQAQEEFYSKYRKIIKDYLRHKFSVIKIGGYDIDDCVSEILIKVFYSLDKYDPEKSNFKTWVLVVAKHFMIDTWRANPVTFTASSFNNTGVITTNGTTGQFLNVNGSSIGWVNEAVVTTTASNSLSYTANGTYTSGIDADFENCNTVCYISSQISPNDFNLLNMKYAQGYNYCEIGKEFNVTSSTVSNRINYIKTKLKKQNSNILD